MGWEFGSLVLVVFVVIETVPRRSVGVMDVKADEDRNDFGVVVEVVVVSGFIDGVSKEPFTLDNEFRSLDV